MSLTYTRERYKTKEEWLSQRGLGGSSASAILGVNPWMDVLELYKSILYKEKRKDTSSAATRYGTLSEPLIRKQFILDFEEVYEVKEPKGWEMYRRKDKPYLTATVDGLLKEKQTKRKGILEIKTHDIRNYDDASNWIDGNIPQNYFVQCLHYLMVMKDCEFVVLCAKLRYFDYFNDDGKKLLKTEYVYHVIWREEVKEQIEYLEKKETEFWENNIINKRIPKYIIKF